MTNSQLTDLRTLILSEVGGFFAVVGSPGEPETPEEMQRELSMRLGRILNNHIVNYPRCEVLVEILRECRTARDEAQAELQERRKADSEPIAWLNDAYLARGVVDGEAGSEDAGPGYIPVYREAQSAPVVPDFKKLALELVGNLVDCGGLDEGVKERYLEWAEKTCRAAMLAAAPQEVKSE